MRNRRILILVVVLVLIGVAAGGAFVLRQRMLDQRALASREAGMQAAEAGDYKRALDQVGRYLQRFGQKDDVEAVYTYAIAVSEIPKPNSKHIVQAIAMLRQALAIDEDHEKARERLLELYVQVGYGEETFALARQILEDEPGNIDALRAEAFAYGWRGEYDEALQRSEAIAQVAPEDLQNHLLALSLLERNSAPDATLLEYANEKTGLEPTDARYKLIQSVAHDLAGDRSASADWAADAAENALVDAEFVSLLNMQLNRLGEFDASLELLRQTAEESGDLELQRALVQRLYEVGDTAEVLARTDDDAENVGSSLLALRALVLAADGTDIAAVVAELESRKADYVAEAWAPLLRAMWMEEDSSPRRVVELSREAIDSEPNNPFFHYVRGLALERLGEEDLALSAYEDTRRNAPAWIDPMLRSARLYAATNRKPEAAALALAALQQMPTNADAAITAAEVIGSEIDTLSENDTRQLARLVSNIQAARPGEPKTLPLHIELLARSGDLAAAQAALDGVIAEDSLSDPQARLNLTRIDAKYGLGRSEELRQLNAGHRTDSPEAVYTNAVALHETGETDRGREIVENAVNAHPDSSAWQLMYAQFLETIGSADATKAWAKAADSDPANARVQSRVLTAQLAWRDPDLIRRSIDRLKAETGADGIAWRIAQARWLLDTDDSEKAAAEATVILNDVIRESPPRPQPHLLMALALDRLGNPDTAIEHVTEASKLSPNSPSIKIELARLLQNRGDADRARQVLDEALASPTTTSSEKRRLAEILATRGDVHRAIDMILESYPEPERDNPPDLALARLYRSVGKLDQAAAICRQLLDDAPGADTIEVSADVFASQGRHEEAERVLQQLESVDAPDGMREMVLAEHYRKHGRAENTVEQVSALYESGVEKAGDNPAWWRRYLAYNITHSARLDFLDNIDAAQKACPSDEGFVGLQKKRDALAALEPWPVVVRVLRSALEDGGRIGAAIEIIDAMVNAGGDASRLIVAFQQLSERHPRFLPVRLELIRFCAESKRLEEAVNFARAATREFPNATEPPWLAAEALGVLGRWRDAEDSAREWRRRSPGDPMQADLMIATAQMRQGNYDAALATIEPYLSASEDRSFSRLRVVQAEALAASGRTDEAATLIAPQLAESAPWRAEWRRYAESHLDADTARQWLEQVAPQIPGDAINERGALAIAYFNAGRRLDEPSFLTEARGILEPLAAGDDAGTTAILSLAVVAEAQGDMDAAEANYRRALDQDKDLAVANNNLAMLLANEGEALEEALELAQLAVASEPNSANYYDTLAHCQAAVGDRESAEASLKRAIELDPNNDKWRERLEELTAVQ